MLQPKRILMVTPSVPFPEHGAEQMDRGAGIRQLKRLGYEVRVIAKTNEWQTDTFIADVSSRQGIRIIGVPYRYSNRRLSATEKILKLLKKFTHILYLDGAAFEYAEPEVQRVLKKEVDEWKPDIVWFEYTYLWPLYHIPRSRNIPIVTRSANFEPEHFLDECGRSFINLIKYQAKLVGERRTSAWSDLIFSITPEEKKKYEKLGARRVVNLPLRALPQYLSQTHSVRDRKPLNVFFMGSTYSVYHNREAVRLVVAQIAPRIHREYPGAFVFHIFGKKLPVEFHQYIKDNVLYAGFQEAPTYLEDMDIALIPSVCGAGMQQKIFQPLAIGIPELTSPRGLAGYAFLEGESVTCAARVDDFVLQLVSMQKVEYRRQLSENSKRVATQLFSEQVLDMTVATALERLG